MPDDPNQKMQTVNVPGVGDVDFPAEMSNQQISDAIKTHYLHTPEHAFKAAPNPMSWPWLKEKFYNAVDKATDLIPAAGATGGAILGGAAGSGVPGPGTIAGGTAGAVIGGGGGEAAKQIVRRWLGYEAPQTSSEAAESIGKEGLTQGAIELTTAGAGRLAPVLKKAAVGQMERALAPTTKITKATTEKIVPEMIDRGVHGSLDSIATQAETGAAAIRPQLDAAYAAMPATSTAGSGATIVADLDKLKAKYIVANKVANPQAVEAINGVQDIVKQYGSDISPDSLRRLKQVFDEPVAAGGGYAGADLTSKYMFKAKRAAANSIRDILSQASPDVAALNKEISFWLDVKRVTEASALRKTGQQGGLVKVLSPLATGAAAAAGLATHGAATSIEAGLTTALATAAVMATRSAQWRTASAILKDRLADVVARGDVREGAAIFARFGVSLPELMKAPPSQPPQTAQPQE